MTVRHKNIISKATLVSALQRLRAHNRGNVAIIFALALPTSIASVGLAVDYGQAFVVKSQLQSATDIAAVSAARQFTSQNRDINARKFFDTNFRSGNHSTTVTNFALVASTANGVSSIKLDTTVSVPTSIMKLFGISTISETAHAEAVKSGSPVELVLALDNTGSMATDAGGGQSRIEALKTAAATLVDSVYGSDETSPKIHIGIIPYTAYVNVGKLLDQKYVQSVPGFTDSADAGLTWKGCVDAEPTNNTINLADGDDPSSSKWNTALDTQINVPGTGGTPLVQPSLFPSFRAFYNHYNNGWYAASGEKCEASAAYTDAGYWQDDYVEGAYVGHHWVKPVNHDAVAADPQCKKTPDSWQSYNGDNLNYGFGHAYNTKGASVFNRAAYSHFNVAQFLGPVNSWTNSNTVNTNDSTVYQNKYGEDPATYRYVYNTYTWGETFPLALAYPAFVDFTDRTENTPELIAKTSDNDGNANYNFWDDKNKDGNSRWSPNDYCPAPAMGLAQHTKTEVKNYLTTSMHAYFQDWGTLSNQAMIWARRMLTPAAPLPALPKASGYTKVVVMMTDGLMYAPGGWPNADQVRTPYGFASEQKLSNDAAFGQQANSEAATARLKKVCADMRKDGIIVYTVTLAIGSDPTVLQPYKDCATTADRFFNAPDAATLQAAFTSIAGDISGVRLSK